MARRHRLKRNAPRELTSRPTRRPLISAQPAQRAADVIANTAARAADRLRGVGLPAALRAWRIDLAVHSMPLTLPNRTVWGAWDPLLRRIELFGCQAPISDERLVATLGHELGHALSPTSTNRSESTATAFAAAWLAALDDQTIGVLASQLRNWGVSA